MSSGDKVDESFSFRFPLAVAASDDLAAWIAETVYNGEYNLGGEHRKRAVKRVYGSIYYHARRGAITKLSGNRYNVAKFFEWACQMKRWSEALHRVPHIVKSVTVNLDGLEIASGVGAFHVHTEPQTHEAAISELRMCHAKSDKLVERNRQLIAENRNLREQLSRQRDTSKRSSEFGKRGAGVKRESKN
jgi:hypothetical protein